MVIEKVFRSEPQNDDYPWRDVVSFVYFESFLNRKDFSDYLRSDGAKEGWEKSGRELTRRIGDAYYKIEYHLENVDSVIISS